MLQRLFSRIKSDTLATLKWVGDEAHRRFVVGAIVGILNIWLHKEIDSNLVDSVIVLIDTALLASWSRHNPEVQA